MGFQYHKPTDEQVAQMQVFRDKYEALANDIKTSGLRGRGISLAFTALEESAMWLNKGITENDGGLN
jgi:hypothetical protein